MNIETVHPTPTNLRSEEEKRSIHFLIGPSSANKYLNSILLSRLLLHDFLITKPSPTRSSSDQSRTISWEQGKKIRLSIVSKGFFYLIRFWMNPMYIPICTAWHWGTCEKELYFVCRIGKIPDLLDCYIPRYDQLLVVIIGNLPWV